MKCNVVVLHTDGSWECHEDVTHFETLDDDAVRLIQEDGLCIDLRNIAMLTIQPK